MTSPISVTNSSTIQKRLRAGLFIPCYIDMIFESDLGERIQQLDEPPSHIVFPSIHKTRQDVAQLFARKIGTDPNVDDLHFLTEVKWTMTSFA